MDQEQAYALARHMQTDLPGTETMRFYVNNGEYGVSATLPDGFPVIVNSEAAWEDEKASYEATHEFQG